MRVPAIVVAGLCLALSGCIKQYVAPTGPQAATIEFKGDLLPGSLFVLYTKGEDCSYMRAVPDEYNFHLANARPLPVQGGQEVAFMIFALRAAGRCQVIVSFLPQPGAQYRALALDEQKYCTVQIQRKESLEGRSTWLPEPSAMQREQHTGLNMSNDAPFCKRVPRTSAVSQGAG